MIIIITANIIKRMITILFIIPLKPHKVPVSSQFWKRQLILEITKNHHPRGWGGEEEMVFSFTVV